MPKLTPAQMKAAVEAFKKQFTGGFYHGSPANNIEAFDPLKSAKDPMYTTSKATFVTRDPEFAESFLSMNNNGKMKSGSTMYPVSVNLGQHWHPNTPEGKQVISDFIEKYPKRVNLERGLNKGDWTAVENSDFLSHLKDTGHDTFHVMEGGVPNVGVFEPQNIRGKFAEFNPDEATNPDFMKAAGGPVQHFQAGKRVLSGGLEMLQNMIKAEGRTPVVPVPNRWFSQPDKFPQVQGLVNKTLENSQLPREAFHSGAFIDPRTGQILDKNIYDDVGVLIDPNTGRPMMSAGKKSGIEVLDPKTGSYTKSNLVRQSLFKPTGGDPMLGEMPFIATIEKGDMGHKYALGTEYATPTEMYNTMTGANPTLRPRSRGDVFGMGDVVGQVQVGGRGIPHDVYEKLFVAPKGSDVPGVKLNKAAGGAIGHYEIGGSIIKKVLEHARSTPFVHYSTSPNISRLEPTMYGSGIKGAEAARLKDAPDIKPRSYFYVDKGSDTMRPEQGLGPHKYQGVAEDIYPLHEDPAGFSAIAKLKALDPYMMSFGREVVDQPTHLNELERLIKGAGYKGYADDNVGLLFHPTEVQKVESHANGGGIAPYGFRHVENPQDVSLPKGTGWFGLLPNKEGTVSTEISADNNGRQYPLINPAMSRQEIDSLLANEKPTDAMYNRAEQWDKYRQDQGKSPFIEIGEMRWPLPKK